MHSTQWLISKWIKWADILHCVNCDQLPQIISTFWTLLYPSIPLLYIVLHHDKQYISVICFAFHKITLLHQTHAHQFHRSTRKIRQEELPYNKLSLFSFETGIYTYYHEDAQIDNHMANKLQENNKKGSRNGFDLQTQTSHSQKEKIESECTSTAVNKLTDGSTCIWCLVVKITLRCILPAPDSLLSSLKK